MRRGDLYRVFKPSPRDPRRFRVFVVVSRDELIASRFSSVICAPIYSAYHELDSQVPVGTKEGLKHESSVYCDDLVSLPKTALSDFVGSLSREKLMQLDRALMFALGLSEPLEE